MRRRGVLTFFFVLFFKSSTYFTECRTDLPDEGSPYQISKET